MPPSSLRPKKRFAPRCGQWGSIKPTLPCVSRNATRSSPITRTRIGAQSGCASSAERAIGCQKRRKYSPMAVPEPVRVRSSLSTAVSMANEWSHWRTWRAPKTLTIDLLAPDSAHRHARVGPAIIAPAPSVRSRVCEARLRRSTGAAYRRVFCSSASRAMLDSPGEYGGSREALIKCRAVPLNSAPAPLWARRVLLPVLLWYPAIGLDYLPFGNSGRYLTVLAGPLSALFLIVWYHRDWRQLAADARAWLVPFLPLLIAYVAVLLW